MLQRRHLLAGTRRALRALKDFVKGNRLTRSLLYDLENEAIFSDFAWHERMLADATRVDAYRMGIARNVKTGDVVIDLGTGTGLLACLAARSGAQQVYAIDHSAFIEVAREIARNNDLTNIEFVRTNSRDFVAPQLADKIVHEQLSSTLFGENMIENLLDLKGKALKPGGLILPGRFELFIEPVVMKDDYYYPHIWEIPIAGFDLKFLKNSSFRDSYKSKRYNLIGVKGFAVDHFLCEPEPLMCVDLNRMASANEVRPKWEVSRTATRDGILRGFCIFFRAYFDEQTWFDNSPTSRQTHWENKVFRVEQRRVRAGDRISYSVDMPVLADCGTWELNVSSP